MKTTLSADGKIGIPDEIRQTDHLAAGDSFELERLTPGHYLLTRQQPPGARSRWPPAKMEFRSSARKTASLPPGW